MQKSNVFFPALSLINDILGILNKNGGDKQSKHKHHIFRLKSVILLSQVHVYIDSISLPFKYDLITSLGLKH